MHTAMITVASTWTDITAGCGCGVGASLLKTYGARPFQSPYNQCTAIKRGPTTPLHQRVQYVKGGRGLGGGVDDGGGGGGVWVGGGTWVMQGRLLAKDGIASNCPNLFRSRPAEGHGLVPPLLVPLQPPGTKVRQVPLQLEVLHTRHLSPGGQSIIDQIEVGIVGTLHNLI